MSTTNPFEAPQFQELLQLEQKRADILSRLEEDGLLTPELKAAYARGLDIIGNQIIQIVRQTDFQNELITYGETAAKNLEGLSPLEGVLPEVEIEPLWAEFTQRLTTVRDFLQRHSEHLSDRGKVFLEQSLGEVAIVGGLEPIIPETPTAPGIEEIPVEPTTAEAPTPEQIKEAKVPLTVNVRHGIVKISKQGKSFKLSTTTAETYFDYSGERLTALKALASGGDWTVQDLKEAVGVPDMDSNHFANIRNWFLDITHGRNRLIESPKRGVYRFSPKYEPEIVEIATSTPERKAPDYVISRGDMYIAANQLSRFNAINRRLFGFEIGGDLIEQLKEFAPDYSAIRGDARAIWQAREDAFARIDRIFEDEDSLYKFLSVISERDPDYAFVDTLIGLDKDQRALLKRFMRSEPEWQKIDENTAHIWVIEKGTKDIVFHMQIDLTEPYETLEEEPAIVEETPRVVTEQVPVKGPDETAEEVVSYDYGEIEAPKRSRLSRENRQRLDAIRVATESVAGTYLEHYNPDRLYRREQLEPHFSRLSTRNVANAVENNVGPSGGKGNVHRNFSIHDVVNVLIYSDPELQNIYSSRLKKQVKYVISQTIQRKIEEQKAKREK